MVVCYLVLFIRLRALSVLLQVTVLRVNAVGGGVSSAETVVASWHPWHPSLLILLLGMGLAPCFWHVLLDG